MNFKNLRRKIVICVIVLICGGVLSLVAYHSQLKSAVDQYKSQLKAAGELPDLSQILPSPVTPEKDGTDLFLQAVRLLKADTSLLSTNYATLMKMVAPGRAMTFLQQTQIEDFDSTNSWPEWEAAVDQNRQAVGLLNQLVDRPELDFKLDYTRGIEETATSTNLMTSLVGSKVAAKYLADAGLANLHRGDTAAAVTNARAILVISAAMKQQRLIISELVSITVSSYARSLTWEILQSADVTDAQLASLQADFEKLNFLQGYHETLAMEQLTSDIQLAKWRSSNAELQKLFDLKDSARENMGAVNDSRWHYLMRPCQMFCWRYWWSYADELRSLHGYAVLQEAAEDVYNHGTYLAAYQWQQHALDTLGINHSHDDQQTLGYVMSIITEPDDFHSILSGGITEIAGTLKSIMTYDTAQQIVITVIALKRYQLQHGSWPEQLTQLTPEFLSAAPLDLVTGQPLHYHPNQDGTYLLYSVGADGVDNGGDPTVPKDVAASTYWLNNHAKDWVWPQPVTSAETTAIRQK